MSYFSRKALLCSLLFSGSFLNISPLVAGPEAQVAEQKFKQYLKLLHDAPLDLFLEEVYKLQQASNPKQDLASLRNNAEVLRIINKRLNDIADLYKIPSSHWDRSKDSITAKNLEDLRFDSKFPGFWYGLRARRMQLASNAKDWLDGARMQRPRGNVEWEDISETEKEASRRFFELKPTGNEIKQFFSQGIRPHSNYVRTYADYRTNKDGITPHFGKLRHSFERHPDFHKDAYKNGTLWADYSRLPEHALDVATSTWREATTRFEALDYLLSRPRAEDKNFIKALESLQPNLRIEYLKRHAALSEKAWSHNILVDRMPRISHLIDFTQADAAEIAKFSPFEANDSQTNKTNPTDSEVALWDQSSKRDFGEHRRSYPSGLVKAEKHIRDTTGKALQLHDAAMLWMAQETHTDAELAEKVAYLNSYTTYGELSADKAQRKSEVLSKLSDSTIYRFMLNVVHSDDFRFNYLSLFHDMLEQIDSPEKAEPWLSQFVDGYLKNKTDYYTKRLGGHIKWSQILKNEKLKEYLIKKYPTLLSDEGPHSLLKLATRTMDFRNSSVEIEALRAVRDGKEAPRIISSEYLVREDSPKSVEQIRGSSDAAQVTAETSPATTAHTPATKPVTVAEASRRVLAHRILGQRLGNFVMSCVDRLRR